MSKDEVLDNNWVAYNAIDEMKRLETELALLRALGEAAQYWLSVEEATFIHADRDSMQVAYSDLTHAINDYTEWEQDL
jgi:ribosomal protein S12 methylthiotransferase accessory factor YcaO